MPARPVRRDCKKRAQFSSHLTSNPGHWARNPESYIEQSRATCLGHKVCIASLKRRSYRKPLRNRSQSPKTRNPFLANWVRTVSALGNF